MNEAGGGINNGKVVVSDGNTDKGVLSTIENYFKVCERREKKMEQNVQPPASLSQHTSSTTLMIVLCLSPPFHWFTFLSDVFSNKYDMCCRTYRIYVPRASVIRSK